MSTSVIDASPLFELSSSLVVRSSPEQVYAVVSDLRSSGEWSPECRGGEWVSGPPAQVGSVFRGENLRNEDVVAWAPLIRGTWYTESRVIAAIPGQTFRWMMLSHAGGDQESVWGFDMKPSRRGSVLTHHFRMGKATNGIRHIVVNLDEDDRKKFIAEWGSKVDDDLSITLQRIRRLVDHDIRYAS